MKLCKVLMKHDLYEVTDEVLKVLGYEPWDEAPALAPILNTILDMKLEEEPEEFLVAIPHLKLRDGVMYEDVSVFPTLDTLFREFSVDAWDDLELMCSPGLKDGSSTLLWDMSKETVEKLLALGKDVPPPLEGLTIPQLRSLELVEGSLRDAAVLIAKYLLRTEQVREREEYFHRIRKLSVDQNREFGYVNLPREPYHAFFNAWERYTQIKQWKNNMAKAILCYRRENRNEL